MILAASEEGTTGIAPKMKKANRKTSLLEGELPGGSSIWSGDYATPQSKLTYGFKIPSGSISRCLIAMLTRHGIVWRHRRG